MTTAIEQDWIEANHRLMAAELGRLEALLGDGDEVAATANVAAARAAMPALAAIDRLTEVFTLSAFERDVLLLAAGAELDTELAQLCGAATGRPGSASVTFGLALATLPDPVWSALAPVRPLRRWRLIHLQEQTGLTGARIWIDERVLHFLVGLTFLDPALEPILTRISEPAIIADTHDTIVSAVVAALEWHDSPLPVIQLYGDDPDGQEDVAARAAARLGLNLHLLHADDVPGDPAECATLAALWEREAALTRSALLIRADGGSGGLARFAERVAGLMFLAGERPLELRRPVLRYAVRRPAQESQKSLWEAALGPEATALDEELDGVAAQFRFSARTIARVASGWSAPDDRGAVSSLWQACRDRTPSRLAALAQRIEPVATWDDLVLDEPQLDALRQITVHVRQRLEVYDAWGFARKSSRGLGISVLFAGESGTGKTMAAELLAGDLELDLYRIDLSAVVSKYIGETEKNLRRVFDAAEESGSVLLFDEADALFGKRSEVKDSHDRYANIEVSYLLQRMEVYRGLAILTTNQKAAMDPAFRRRLRFIVEFPFPGLRQREAIWRRIFPAETPLDGIDYASLARLNAPGGVIRNIALNAAFLAAAEKVPVTMRHLLRAARTEAGKRERPMSPTEVQGWQ
ncbi:AAA family ATPase [Rhodococcus sp. T2V]|uniref:ATP-binding protein n=1 Tax=Rhodococcus sp. T2V TaxID=3034164 RepID=UPI0023E1A2B7|nr:AAA family ATPase [Rhodococcus sp. T2V]MDF3308907.1 AAA family ATPase [Rhodococcus sp. T2V]